MLLSKCAVCNSKNSKLIKEQEARGLISKLVGIKIFLFQKHKMNPIVNKLLLAGEIFMPEIHLRQLRFTFSVCGPFTKNKERIKIFKEIGDSISIYENELDEFFFQNDIAYGVLNI